MRRRLGHQRIAVPKNPLNLRLSLDHDERLAAAAGGAMRVFADAAGLPNENIEQLKTAVVSACKLCFDFHNGCDTPCQVSFRRLDDRIEVEVTVPGVPPPANKPEPHWAGVDDIQCENRNNSGVLRLTKFLHAAS
jgi:anti-sigma regulatory factor (Ser/Thr protein kinase)